MAGHLHETGCGCAGFAPPGAPAEGSLLPYIDLARVRCLNESAAGSARGVFKGLADAERREPGRALESCEGDGDLLLHVPFTCTVRVMRLCIASCAAPPGARAPARCRLFAGRADLDFSAAEGATPEQDVALVEDAEAGVWYPLRVAKFSNVTSVQLFLSGAAGGALGDDERVRVSFVGLKGEVTGHVSSAPGVIVYESAPRPADHVAAAGAGGARATIDA